MTWLKTRYQPTTVRRYLWEIERFCKLERNAQNASREQILSYIELYRQKERSPDYLRAILAVLKVWYRYLIETGQREDHPCKYLLLRDQRNNQVQLQDLFTTGELEVLLERKERYPILQSRNQMITGFLIYQGFTVGELCKLRPKDIDLENARISVPATKRTNSRILSLNPREILPIHRYISRDREKLLNGKESDALIITKKGTDESGEGITYLITSQSNLFPGRKLSPQTIRMSVITNWLKQGLDLRKAQHRAGHKKPSSTERYKQSDVEKLKLWIEKYHPLG